MSTKAGLQLRHTNHSGRHTAIQTLQEEGYGGEQIIHLTGHKNPAGLAPYSRASEKVQREISAKLTKRTSGVAVDDRVSVPENTGTLDKKKTKVDQELYEEKFEGRSAYLTSYDVLKSATIHGNVHVNHYHGEASRSSESTKSVKRRRVVIESESSQESQL